MTSSSLMVSLPQMVDLALGSPEVGAVNFNMLNAVLQVILQQMKLNDCTVEFRGSDSERVQSLLATAKAGLSVKITEYQSSEDPNLNKKPKLTKGARHSSVVESEIKEISPRRNSKDEPQIPNAFAMHPARQHEITTSSYKIVLVEPTNGESTIDNVPRVTVNMTQNRLKEFEEDIDYLKNKMEEILEMPNNSTLMEAVRGVGVEKTTPVTDMWHALNLTKRVDATETGVNKLASMVEDLVREISEAAGGGPIISNTDGARPYEGTEGNVNTEERVRSSRVSIFADIASRIDALEKCFAQNDESGNLTRAVSSAKQEDEIAALANDVEALKTGLKALEENMSGMTKGFKGKSLGDMLREVEDLKGKVTGGKSKEEEEEGGKGGIVDEQQVTELENRFGEYSEKLNNLDETFNRQMSALQNQLLEVEKELGSLLERVNTSLVPNEDIDGTSMGDLFNKIMKLQEELEAVTKVTNRLTEEQDERQQTMDAFIEQIELLKTVKADREDLEDALADKADTQHMNRKVSHDQFDAACDDLTKGIEETMMKLTQQEGMWQSTLEELQTTIGCKLDRLEFDPLRDFVNKKIKSLQQRLKALLAMKQEQEAAGTKSRILKNVNCISCDKDVIMYKQNQFATLPSPPVLPGTRSMRPYITYELDAVRKQQKSLPQGRNMNHLETAMQEGKPVKDKPIDPKGATLPGHLCNRYCGGSHTMTTPQQRVAHIGHFLTQWGPQAVPLDEGHVMGTDGLMYKAREGGDTSPRKDLTRLSASMQTEEPKENVKRMSQSIEPTGKSKLSISMRRTSRPGSVQIASPEPKITEESDEPTKEKSVEDGGASGRERKRSVRLSTSSIRKGSKSESKRPSTASASVPKLTEASETPRGSTTRRSSTMKREGSRPSIRKSGSISLKRLSQAEVKRQASQLSQKENMPPDGADPDGQMTSDKADIIEGVPESDDPPAIPETIPEIPEDALPSEPAKDAPPAE